MQDTEYKSVRSLSRLLLAALLCVSAPFAVQAEPFSLICMPDPQYYTTSNHENLYDLYRRQAYWARDNEDAYNIQHVIWLGDLTNDNTFSQWTTAHRAYSILDAADIPYAVVPGNHDYKTNTGWAGAQLRELFYYNNVVGPQRFAAESWYGGNMGNTPDHNENNYTYFSSNGLDFLVVGLEYAPRKEVLTWANNLIAAHPNHRVIIFTHAYMVAGGGYIGGAGAAAGTVGAAGIEIFEECASRHSNVFMVVCGHVTESVVNTKTGVGGNRIYEMLVDYQAEKVLQTGANLGNGWLRILQFNPETNKINASTVTAAPGDDSIFINGISQFYFNRYGSSPTAPDHLFTLDYDMGPTEPYTYLVDSVKFHAMGIGSNLHSDQLDPDIAQANNANWAAVWEDDSDDSGIYEVLVRGFDPDGNERFAKSLVNTSGPNLINATNPAIAMAADGKFAVVWQSGSNQIKMRSYNADGTPVGGQDQPVVSVTSPGTVNNPDVAIDDSGNFVVVWADDGDGNGVFQIRARGYTSNYTPRFATKTVNTLAAGQQVNPAIAMAGNGDYIIVWEDDRAGTWDLGLSGYLANETPKFAETLANVTTDGEQLSPAIAMDDTGRFVVVWEDDADLNSSFQIKARGFGATGTELFSERTVNVIATANQINPAVDMDSVGNWYAAWQDNGVSGQGYQIMSNAYDITGTRLNADDVRANSITSVTHRDGNADRRDPVISAHKSGRYVVSWADNMDGDNLYQGLARGMAGTAQSLVVKAINGTVTKSPDDAFYAPGATVTLTATGTPGNSFVKWSGNVPAGNETANPLTVTMNSNVKLTAEFTGSARVGDWQLY